MPETYLWVLQRVLDVRRPGPAPRTGVPLMGCTSALAWGEATRDGKLLHGRNFDYQGVGSWDREQAVVFHRPKQGMPYVSVSAAGILFGGITAMSSAGLTLVVHQHMASRALRLGGTPIGIAGDRIMRHARSLDDARRMLDDDTPNGCWTYVIGSAREQSVLCYETSPGRRAALRVDDGSFGYANVYLDPELGRTEHHLYPAHWRNNLARLERARSLLAERRGEHDPGSIAAILGDLGGSACRFESGIAMLMTVASVVFRPDDGVFYVATGRAPVSSREYVAFDLTREAARPELEPLAGSCSGETEREAFDAYRDAYEAYFDHGDLRSARSRLARALELRPDQALYHFVAGLLALLDSDPAAAEQALDAAIRMGHPVDERRSAFHLWRARARDLVARRSEALTDYRIARSATEPAVRDAAARGLRSSWRPRRFGIEFSFADVPVP
jgi:tetratricopeptide (TPR) repeat protein